MGQGGFVPLCLLIVAEPKRRVMEYGSFGREKHPLETYCDVIEESISDIRYFISRIPYPSEEPKNVFKRIRERFKRIHDQSREGNKWIRWCKKTKEEERS